VPYTPSPTTITLWTDRVRAWRESGQSASDFALGKDFKASTLRHWSTRLRRSSKARFVPLVRAPEPAPAVTSIEPACTELVVEVGAVRVRVTPGFDPPLLAEVVRALGVAAR
jgi:hypothetical protein